MSTAQAVGVGIGALVAAEATGVTNFSGSDGGVNVTMPTKDPGEAIPNSGLDPSIVTALLNQDSGPSDSMLAALMNQSQQGLSDAAIAALISQTQQQVRERTPLPDDAGNGQSPTDRAREWFNENVKNDDDGNDGSNSSSSSSRSQQKDRSNNPTNVGEMVGNNTSGLLWGLASGPAEALDENTWLDGDAGDNIDDITDKTTDPVGDAARGAWDAVKPNGKGRYKVFENKTDEGPLTPGDGTFDPTQWFGGKSDKPDQQDNLSSMSAGEAVNESANIIGETANNWAEKGITGKKDTSVKAGVENFVGGLL